MIYILIILNIFSNIRTIMKCVILCLLSLLPLYATPDRADNTHETFLGSNEKFYATFVTEIDNQGSYYEWREIKKLNEYSKQDGSMINSTMLTDILYSIDANHNNPNKPPKITSEVQSQNKDTILSNVITTYHLPLTPAEKPDWLNRLSWEKGNIIMDKKLLIVSKDTIDLLKKRPDIDDEEEEKEPDNSIEKSILKVYSDSNSIYLLLKIDTDTDFNTHLIHLSEETTKQLRDRVSLLDEYILIKSFKNFEEANVYSRNLIKSSQEKSFYGLNPEIWLSKKTESSEYLLVHRPLEVPINIDQIQRLDAATGIKSTNIKSDTFVEKWIPFIPYPKEDPEQNLLQEAEDAIPEGLLEKPVE